MEIFQAILGGLMTGFVIGLLIGFFFGVRAGARTVLKALNVPPGSRITSVGYEKI